MLRLDIIGGLQLAVVLFLTYLILWLKSINKMVDIVTNRMFETFYRFAPGERQEVEPLATISNLQRFSSDKNRNFYRHNDYKEREKQLFSIKENTADVIIPKQRPFMGLSCDYCTPSSRESLINKTTERLSLNNILDHTPTNNKNNYLQRVFSHLNQVYQLKKYDYPQVADFVLKDERLKHAIEKTTLQQYQDTCSRENINDDNDELYQQLLKNNQRRAKKILYDMRSTLSDFLLRFTSWVLYKLLPCFLSCVVAHRGQINMLKEASKTSLPLIFLPLHRSHLDYILISFILLNNNIRSPLVAAGDNLRIPFFGSLLRGLGAFFIKRRIDPIMGRKDHLYKSVLHTYMYECLKAGHYIEFYLEGGRTRTGKPCMPKYGILSVIVQAYIDGIIEDALLVPVSVNYDRLVDGNFIREQLGQPKEMETFGAAIKGIWHVLNSDYGMMRIDFNQPFSLKELVKTFNTTGKIPPNGFKKVLKSNPSTQSLYGTDLISDEHKSLVESISKHIIYDCARSTSVMSTNAIAFLLLIKYRDGVKLNELVIALDELRKDLEYEQKDLGFVGDSIDIINYAVDMLGPGLIQRERLKNNEILIKPIIKLPNVIELTYYSNTLVTHYAFNSIIAISLKSVTKDGLILFTNLFDTILELCTILQYEFIFCKPCQNLDRIMVEYVDDLAIRREIFIKSPDEDVQNRRMARQFDDDDLDEANVEKPRTLTNNSITLEYLCEMRRVLMPLIETYAISAFALRKLIGNSLLEREIVHDILNEIQIHLTQGDLRYEEAKSVDPIKNALKLFQKWEILDCHMENNVRCYYLKDNHDNIESVDGLFERINKFRFYD